MEPWLPAKVMHQPGPYQLLVGGGGGCRCFFISFQNNNIQYSEVFLGFSVHVLKHV